MYMKNKNILTVVALASLVCLALTVCLVSAFSGNAGKPGKDGAPAPETPTAIETVEAQTPEEPTPAAPTEETAEPSPATEEPAKTPAETEYETEETDGPLTTETVDVNDRLNEERPAPVTTEEDTYLDFSALNEAEQYEAILPIILDFDAYAGKTLRAHGAYRTVNERAHLYVADSECGGYVWIELVYAGETPLEGDPITVEGELSFYENEEGEQCPCLLVSELTVDVI